MQGYTGPYQDSSPDKLGLTAIDTPDDRTIVFKLKQAVQRVRLLRPAPGDDARCRRPRTPARKYKEHVVSTGPYMFQTNDLGKSFALVRNPNWDQATDPNRKPLPDRIEVALNVNADDIDNRLLAGDLDVDVDGHRRAGRRRRAGSSPTRR